MEQVTLHGKPIFIGNKIWNIKHGWIIVEEISTDEDYPIITHYGSCTIDGKQYLSDKSPSSFWQEQTFNLNKPFT